MSDHPPLADRARPYFCLDCRTALATPTCDRHPSVQAVRPSTPRGRRAVEERAFEWDGTLPSMRRRLWRVLAVAVFIGMFPAVITYVKRTDPTLVHPLNLIGIIALGLAGCAVALVLGERSRARVQRGVSYREGEAHESTALETHEGVVVGEVGEVVGRRLVLELDDATVFFDDSTSIGFSIRTDDGNVIDVPAGQIRLEPHSHTTELASKKTVRRWMTDAALPRRLFPHDRARLIELRAGERVAIHAPMDRVDAGYRERGPRTVEGVATITLLPA